MKMIFISQGYKQLPSKTQENVFENVLCDVFEMHAFGRIFLKYKPLTDELLDTSDSNSTGDIDSTGTEQI